VLTVAGLLDDDDDVPLVSVGRARLLQAVSAPSRTPTPASQWGRSAALSAQAPHGGSDIVSFSRLVGLLRQPPAEFARAFARHPCLGCLKPGGVQGRHRAGCAVMASPNAPCHRIDFFRVLQAQCGDVESFRRVFTRDLVDALVEAAAADRQPGPLLPAFDYVSAAAPAASSGPTREVVAAASAPHFRAAAALRVLDGLGMRSPRRPGADAAAFAGSSQLGGSQQPHGSQALDSQPA
jgi:hypothetical protein